MTALYLITARGGSKGLPGKNIKLLRNKPLLEYSLEIARALSDDRHICLSTDDVNIRAVAENSGLSVPFLRPAALASDTAGSREVILHALDFYMEKGVIYDSVILLQPTTPFRSTSHILEMQQSYSPDLDMVVSVKESHHNPYFSLFEENSEGYLNLSKSGNFIRRQDCPKAYAFNGSVYIINAKSLRRQPLNQFTKVKKYVMDEIHSVDIDNQFDWWIAEMILQKSLWPDNKSKL
jgi:N-acylneuraminate cytidylyltransferase